MRQSNILYLVAAGVASAAWQLQPGNPGSIALGGLLGRQADECTSRSTCSSCYGEGYVICDISWCFNPDIHQQCCSEGSICVGKTNKCCSDWGGPGETGTAGVPNVTARPLPTAAPTDATAYYCTRGDEGEECCQRAQPPLHWCSGDFPNHKCYYDKNQWCCSDGTVCDEEDCCDLFNASPTHPWSTGGATATPTGSTTGGVTEAATSSATGSDTTTGVESTTTSTGGVGVGSRPELMAVGLAALGFGFL